ncbi:MAG TPA: aldo/keto reductase, partial [Blastocatellia bacterium]|nr:aldo/keto reductase [Blastocatellia bacterium]
MTHATPEATAAYRQRFAGQTADLHFRQAQNLWMSSLGLGSYLGNADAKTDAGYETAVIRAAELGCNVFDTAANYRMGRSEQSFGNALAKLMADGKLSRGEFIVTTKGGYLPFETGMPRSQAEFLDYLQNTFVKPGICELEDFVQGQHCMTPGYLQNQLDNSLRKLQLDCIDVYYIHNPESQFAEVSQAEFYTRLRASFEFLESAVAEGKIAMYATATWNGYRAQPNSRDYLSLEQVVATAREVAGDNHHFKVVQLPFNLAMTEALTLGNQTVNGQAMSLLEAAEALGVTVMASASMLQAKLASGLPEMIADVFPGLQTDAQRAIQFTRSAPGMTTALIGMSQVAHVEENLQLAKINP